MRADSDIRREVEQKLDTDPKIGARDIAVSVRRGVVMLAGFVGSRKERAWAEADAMQVAGFVGLANDIEVRLPLLGRRTDPEIARGIIGYISIAIPTLNGRVRVRVADGEVTLEGEAESHHERMRAESVASRVKGIRSISNDIRVMPRALAADITRRIQEAFELEAKLEAAEILVQLGEDGTVVLTGSVRSLAERIEAERTAWSVRGVRRVENLISVLE
jgi:osmotically-inducible protein OsmY